MLTIAQDGFWDSFWVLDEDGREWGHFPTLAGAVAYVVRWLEVRRSWWGEARWQWEAGVRAAQSEPCPF